MSESIGQKKKKKERSWVVTFLYSPTGEMNGGPGAAAGEPSSWSFGVVGVHAEKMENAYETAIKKLAHDFQTNPIVDREGCAMKHVKFCPLGIFPSTDKFIDGEGFEFEPEGEDGGWEPGSIPYELEHQEEGKADGGTE